jgi:hypothetical protein
MQVIQIKVVECTLLLQEQIEQVLGDPEELEIMKIETKTQVGL